MKLGGDMEEIEIKISATKLKCLWERCCDACSSLESQVVRNPDLPKGYRKTVTEAYAWLAWLNEELKKVK